MLHICPGCRCGRPVMELLSAAAPVRCTCVCIARSHLLCPYSDGSLTAHMVQEICVLHHPIGKMICGHPRALQPEHAHAYACDVSAVFEFVFMMCFFAVSVLSEGVGFVFATSAVNIWMQAAAGNPAGNPALKRS